MGALAGADRLAAIVLVAKPVRAHELPVKGRVNDHLEVTEDAEYGNLSHVMPE